ncbi:hypothetical protein Fmac_006392 [Flemingia macrophylla]|uniref:Uncharacterized protein n=1 Tax=Flemingia macrophylla TaxID=520843 RepID=A0ABD1NBN7_9FABA
MADLVAQCALRDQDTIPLHHGPPLPYSSRQQLWHSNFGPHITFVLMILKETCIQNFGHSRNWVRDTTDLATLFATFNAVHLSFQLSKSSPRVQLVSQVKLRDQHLSQLDHIFPNDLILKQNYEKSGIRKKRRDKNKKKMEQIQERFVHPTYYHFKIRHGYAHVANNLYQGWVQYVIGGSMGPSLKSEANHFIAPTTGIKR